MRTPHLQGHELVPVFQDVAIPLCKTLSLGLEEVLRSGDKHHRGGSLLATCDTKGRDFHKPNNPTNSVLRNVPCDSRALYSKRARPRRRSLLGPLTAPAKKGMGNEDLATRARFKLDDCSIRDIENNRTARFDIVWCRTFMVSTLGSFGIVGVGLIGSEFGVAF